MAAFGSRRRQAFLRWSLEHARWALEYSMSFRRLWSLAYAIGSGHATCEAVPFSNRSSERANVTANAEFTRGRQVVVILPSMALPLRTTQYHFALDREKPCIAHAICKLDFGSLAGFSFCSSFARTLDTKLISDV